MFIRIFALERWRQQGDSYLEGDPGALPEWESQWLSRFRKLRAQLREMTTAKKLQFTWECTYPSHRIRMQASVPVATELYHLLTRSRWGVVSSEVMPSPHPLTVRTRLILQPLSGGGARSSSAYVGY